MKTYYYSPVTYVLHLNPQDRLCNEIVGSVQGNGNLKLGGEAETSIEGINYLKPM